MHYLSEKDIVDLVTKVIAEKNQGAERENGMEVPVEMSGRHVHLDRATMDILFGEGAELTPKKELSQPGQYLAEERVKLVTERGQLSGVAVLGPLRSKNQAELSLTDARTLGLKVPIRLSGDVQGAPGVLIIGPKGAVMAKECCIAAKAHVHMTPEDAEKYGVQDGESVSVRLQGERPILLEDVAVRVNRDYRLAVHIDCDEANAAGVGGGCVGRLLRHGE